jgi:hypothetical protein
LLLTRFALQAQGEHDATSNLSNFELSPPDTRSAFYSFLGFICVGYSRFFSIFAATSNERTSQHTANGERNTQTPTGTF